MGNDLDPLILDIIEWIAREPRTYVDLIDAWRTSCPRLTVWEDAVDRGLVVRARSPGGENRVVVSDIGMALLSERRPWSLMTNDSVSTPQGVVGNGRARPPA